jgi:D-alanyl-D-alanine carboxypeptidase
VEFDAVLTGLVSSTDVRSLAVGVWSDGRRVVASGGPVPVTAESGYRIASLTKLFTATAAVTALSRRHVPLSTPAVDLLPALAPGWRADPGITVEHLLAQVSGLRPSVGSAALADLGTGDDALSAGARLVVGAGSDVAPGARWSYYNGNYLLLGAVLAEVTGVSFEDALARGVLGPWGLARTGFGPPRAPVDGWVGAGRAPDGAYPRARRPSGGLWSCVADLLRFAERLVDSGALLDETRRSRTRSGDPMCYGLGWALGPSGQMVLNGRLPGYRAAIVVLPGDRFAAVALANEQDSLPAIARILSDLQAPFTGDDIATRIDAFAA